MRRIGVAALIGVWAAAVVSAGITPSNSKDYSLVLAAAAGGFLGGLICAPFFGRMGRRGWAWALGAGIAATFVGGFLAGLGMNLMASPDDFIFGARATLLGSGMLGGLVALSWPLSEFLVAGVWLAGLIGIHLTARRI